METQLDTKSLRILDPAPAGSHVESIHVVFRVATQHAENGLHAYLKIIDVDPYGHRSIREIAGEPEGGATGPQGSNLVITRAFDTNPTVFSYPLTKPRGLTFDQYAHKLEAAADGYSKNPVRYDVSGAEGYNSNSLISSCLAHVGGEAGLHDVKMIERQIDRLMIEKGIGNLPVQTQGKYPLDDGQVNRLAKDVDNLKQYISPGWGHASIFLDGNNPNSYRTDQSWQPWAPSMGGNYFSAGISVFQAHISDRDRSPRPKDHALPDALQPAPVPTLPPHILQSIEPIAVRDPKTHTEYKEPLRRVNQPVGGKDHYVGEIVVIHNGYVVLREKDGKLYYFPEHVLRNNLQNAHQNGQYLQKGQDVTISFDENYALRIAPDRPPQQQNHQLDHTHQLNQSHHHSHGFGL